jgi:hypothetical protein
MSIPPKVDYDRRVPPASRMARYVPDELLGSAGLVDTYSARIQGESGMAALKVLFLDRAEESIARPLAERFMAAGRRALASPAPGIARVLEVSDEVESVFVATELLPGVDFAHLVESARKRHGARGAVLEPVLAGLLCAQVARVLATAHESQSPLFHLGLCPGNVVVTPAARVMVLDFGLASALRGLGACPIEKWRFVAPELLGLDATSLSPESATAADLYSLGALLFFLLSGRQPVEAATLTELSERMWEPLPDVPGVPNRLLSAVRALTAPDPKERPESASSIVGWLSGDIYSPQETQAYLVKALQTSDAGPGPAANLGQPAARAKPAASAKSRALGLHRGVAMSAVRSRNRRWLSRALLASAILAGFGIVAWSRLGSQRASRGHASQKGSKKLAGLPNPETMGLSRVEIPAMQPGDGGLSGEAQSKPTDRVYMPGPKHKLPRVPNHLFLATNPDQADVWVDGVLRGRTPVDLEIGPGGHRVVVIKPGYLMLRAVYDTTEGEYVRKDLQRAGVPRIGDAFLEVQCPDANKYPVVLDDEETGLLCPVARLPVTSGKHSIGIYVPVRRAIVAVEVEVAPGSQPLRVVLKD